MRTIGLSVSTGTLARLAEHQANLIRAALVNLHVARAGLMTTRQPADLMRECRVIHRSITDAADRSLFRALLHSYLHPEAVR